MKNETTQKIHVRKINIERETCFYIFHTKKKQLYEKKTCEFFLMGYFFFVQGDEAFHSIRFSCFSIFSVHFFSSFSLKSVVLLCASALVCARMLPPYDHLIFSAHTQCFPIRRKNNNAAAEPARYVDLS